MIREKIIAFQNQSEQKFEESKTFSSTFNYTLAFGIFMASTMLATFRMPFALLKKSLYKSPNGSLQKITTSNIEEVIQQQDLVILDFWAEWCGPCLMMESVLKNFAEDNKQLVVGKINADTQSSLLKKYNIRGLPHLLLIKGGKEIKRYAGSMTYVQLEQFSK